MRARLVQAASWSQAVDQLRDLAGQVVTAAPRAALGLIVAALFLPAGTLLRVAARRLRDRGDHWRLAVVMGRLAQGFALVMGLLVGAVIAFPGFTPTSLLQFVGIGSVAFGFAFRDVLQNYLAGILLLLTHPFGTGDQIVFGGFEGTVEDIQPRAFWPGNWPRAASCCGCGGGSARPGAAMRWTPATPSSPRCGPGSRRTASTCRSPTQVLFHDQTEETDGDRLRQREGWPAGKGASPAPRAGAPDASAGRAPHRR